MYYIMVCSENPNLVTDNNDINGAVNLTSDCFQDDNNNSICIDQPNSSLHYVNTSAVTHNTDMLTLEIIRHYIYNVTLPIIFSFGMFGNVMNLVIFTRRRMRSRMSEVEKAATTGLMSLALADFCFCLVGLISHFLSPSRTSFSSSTWTVSAFYYTCYERALLNTFLFISTWVITVLSIERWAAATYPFLARRFVDVRRSVLINVGIYVVSIIFNIPVFLAYEIEKTKCTDSCWCYVKTKGILRQNPRINEAYEILWGIVGTFIPILLLVFCNIRFLQEIHRSRAQFKSDDKTSSRRSNCSTGSKATLTRITVILAAIIGMFLVLVCPSSILGFLITRLKHLDDIKYQIALVIFNLIQTINFAANFLLYCTMSREFRSTLLKLLCKCHPRSRSTSTNDIKNLTENPINQTTVESKISLRSKPEWL